MFSFDKAINTMSGYNTITRLSVDSKDIDVLDYLAMQICHCLDTSKFAFHGGYILNKVVPADRGRATYDIDIAIVETEFYNEVKKVLINVAEELIKDSVIVKYKIKDSATEKCSGGIDLYRESKKKLGVDVGVRDLKHGLVSMNMHGTDVMRFTVEHMLSDKLRAIYSDNRFRRAKDLYDFYLLTNCFSFTLPDLKQQLDIDGGLDLSKSPFCLDYVDKYYTAYSGVVVKDLRDTSIVLDKFDFYDILKRLSGIVECIDMNSKWNCEVRSIGLC